MANETCAHLTWLTDLVDPAGKVCTLCVEVGDTWVHLRACLDCGMVGCCDSSKNRHARKHWGAHSHPLIQSIEPGESWRYCFIDDVAVA